MKNLLLYLALIAIIPTCNSQIENKKVPTKTTKSDKFEEAVYQVENDDTEMKVAIETARKTFGEFEKALKSENPNFVAFTIKKPYESTQGEEHLWIRSILYNTKKDTYVGIIASDPQFTTQVKYDDIVEITRNEISDWYYVENNVLKGGYTIKLLRSRMTASEQKQFDKESGFIFE